MRQNNRYNEITVKGFSTLTFENVEAGKITIWQYHNKDFVRDAKGKPIELKREWRLDKVDNDCFEYWLDTGIYFPYGSCDLKLYTKGKVFFEFDSDDCVDYMEYITNPDKSETFWGYLKNQELTSNSYTFKDLNNE